MSDKHHEDQGHIEITVVNEDNGRDIKLDGGKGTPIRTLIERMYTLLSLTRQSGDRLRCESSGEDVFPFLDLHLGQYLEAGHCPDRTWLFAGATGGAM